MATEPTGESSLENVDARGERAFKYDEVLLADKTILLNALGDIPTTPDLQSTLVKLYGPDARYSGLVKVFGQELHIVYRSVGNDFRLSKVRSFKLDRQVVPEVFVLDEMGDRVEDIESHGVAIDFQAKESTIAITNIGQNPVLVSGDVLKQVGN